MAVRLHNGTLYAGTLVYGYYPGMIMYSGHARTDSHIIVYLMKSWYNKQYTLAVNNWGKEASKLSGAF